MVHRELERVTDRVWENMSVHLNCLCVVGAMIPVPGGAGAKAAVPLSRKYPL